MRGMRWNAGRAGLLTLAGVLACAGPRAQAAPTGSDLPWGSYPTLTEGEGERKVEDLRVELRDLGSRVETTVRRLASRRNLSCFGGPCLLQAFPLVYTKPRSGFWGGFRANLTRLSDREDEPAFQSFLHFARSDTREYQSSFGTDFPRIFWLPFDPRWKFQFFTSYTTETRYYGSGPLAVTIGSRPDVDFRYALREYGFQTSLLLRTFRLDAQAANLFASFSTIHHLPAALAPESKLFEDAPVGIGGGWSSRVGLGLQIDTRDNAFLPKKGWSFEVSGEVAGEPLGNFAYQRLTMTDRRYIGNERFTLANRLTVDAFVGDPPFWELTSVGGLDPIRDVSYSRILRGYARGRFHEKLKFLESAEFRWRLRDTKFFGLNCEITWIPVGLDVGRLGDQTAFSGSTGALLVFNKSFPVVVFASRSLEGSSFHLQFEMSY